MSHQGTSNAKTSSFTVLVTGANSGLGFATCCRLIDEFLHTRPSSQSIHILFTTRDSKKRSQTLHGINAHLKNTLKEVDDGRADRRSGSRVTIQGVLVDLTRLLTVKALAQKLRQEFTHIDAIICNAGIGGWLGLHWPTAVYQILTDFMQATTFPTFQAASLGLVTKPQLESTSTNQPALGEVFTANVFGHYMLIHWLAPLLDDNSRTIWVSSLSAQPAYFNPDDLQRLHATESYESSKRVTDLMVLTSELRSTEPYVQQYFEGSRSRPVMYLTQPGVVFTTINGLHWFFNVFIAAAFWLARWLGSPWHTVRPYTGAVSAVWTCLAPDEQLRDYELRDGKGKWGSTVTVYGDEGVRRTETEWWGYGGIVGSIPTGSVSGKAGRWRERTTFTEEQRIEFEQHGRLVWRELEDMRKQWEERLGPLEI